MAQIKTDKRNKNTMKKALKSYAKDSFKRTQSSIRNKKY